VKNSYKRSATNLIPFKTNSAKIYKSVKMWTSLNKISGTRKRISLPDIIETWAH